MGKGVALSRRLQALAQLVTPGSRVCDVGCDHGYLSIYLVQKGISPSVIAMDVRKGPLSGCREHVREYGLEEYIDIRLSDGLAGLLPGEADTVVCAGMGGRLMKNILLNGQEKAQGLKELVLQPQSELRLFREFLRSQGYCTVAENMIEEDSKFYPMMKVVWTGAGGSAAEDASDRTVLFDRFGEKLLADRNPALKRFLEYRRRLLLEIRKNVTSGNARERLSELDRELADVERALDDYF